MSAKLEAIAERVGSRLNPIVVKELRQAMRSRFILGVFFVMVVIFTFIALFASWFTASGVTNTSGPGFFIWVYSVVAFGTLLFVPGYAGSRIGIERAGQDPDLLFITTLKPSSIVRGKALVASLIALFLVSTALPFMAFAYTLRGIDLPNIALIMLLTFIASCAASYLAILIGSIPTGKIGKVVLFLASLYGLLMLSIGAIASVVTSLDVGGVISGLGRITGASYSADIPILLFSFGLAVGCVMWIAHSLSTALISPRTSNRIMPIRLCLSVITLVLTVVFGIFHILDPGVSEIGTAAIVFGILVYAFGLLLAVCERVRPGPRVAATIPKNRLSRMAVFPFFTGSANGIVWCLLLGGFIVLLCLVYSDVVQLSGLRGVTTLLLYMLAYALSALLLRKTVLRKIVHAGQTWGLTLLLMAVVSLFTFFVTDIIGQASGFDIEMPYGNLIHFAGGEAQVAHFLFALIWALLVTLLWFPMAYRQVEAFDPTNEDPIEA